MPACILVVEDEPAIRELICMNLAGAGHVVMKTGDVENAQRIIRETLPNLVILDWGLPGASGLELVRKLRAEIRTRRISIIMLTARGAEDDRVAGFEAGVDDYITKPFSPRELLARIKTILRRRAPHTTDDSVDVCGLRLEPPTRRVMAGRAPIRLGPLEFKLLHFLMTHTDHVHTRTDLLDRVWGDDVYVEERTVDVHIRRLRGALGPHGFDQLIQTVRGTGYRLSSEPTIGEAA
jgi:two-component system phosphate regulon response regulator PhoB